MASFYAGDFLMDINNYPTSVPTQVKQLFYSKIPFGSEYYIYSSGQSQQGLTVFDMLLRKVGEEDFTHYTISRNTTASPYTLNTVTAGDISEVSIQYPYYCYSSDSSQGIVEQLPAAQNLNTMLLIVIGSLAVLKIVFGGIRWVRRKSYV